jgi:hypothetical protein
MLKVLENTLRRYQTHESLLIRFVEWDSYGFRVISKLKNDETATI